MGLLARLGLAGILLAMMAVGCARQPPSSCELVLEQPRSAQTAPIYVDDKDPYWPGNLAVETRTIDGCDDGPPVPLRVHAPNRELSGCRLPARLSEPDQFL